MKNLTLLIILFIFTLSCNNSNDKKIDMLINENLILQNQVKVLKDSLSDFEEDFLQSQILIGIADKTVLKVEKDNNVVMLFQTHNRKLPEYEIYTINDNKKTKVGTNNKTRFNINFTPKSLEDNKLNLEVMMHYKEKPIIFNSSVKFDLEQ